MSTVSNSVNSVNSVNSDSAVLPPSPLVFFTKDIRLKTKSKGARGPKQMSKRSTWTTAVSRHHHFPASLFYLSPPNVITYIYFMHLYLSAYKIESLGIR